jgi:hypothetical protein
MKANNDNSSNLLAKGKNKGTNTPTVKIRYESIRRGSPGNLKLYNVKEKGPVETGPR